MTATEEAKQKVCGIIMPISNIDECGETHWAEVLEIFNESIETAGFEGNLVSHADEVGIIHKRIIQNLYDNPIVIADVSCKNPNVMFELGLRLAFDKPTIIVKDNKTSYSFDTSAIEHLEYPRDLRFSQIVEFKQKLAEKIKATHKKATADSNYTTFLKHFGEFKVAKIDKTEVPGQEYILEELKYLRRSIGRLEHGYSPFRSSRRLDTEKDIDICLGPRGKSGFASKMRVLEDHPGIKSFSLTERDKDHYHLMIDVNNGFPVSAVEKEISNIFDRPGRWQSTKSSKKIIDHDN